MPKKVTLTLRNKKALDKVLALIAKNPRLQDKMKVIFTGSVTDLTNTAHQALKAKAKVKVTK